MRTWLVSGDGFVRAAHVEGDGFHRSQHRGGSDNLGWLVDDLRGAEYGPDAVQDARLPPRPYPRPAGGQSAHGHLLGDGRAGAHGCDCGGAVHQLYPGGVRESPGCERRRGHFHRQWSVCARASLLDGQQHHIRLLQPTGAIIQEEGDRRSALHRLGCLSDAADRGVAAVLLLPLQQQLRILGKVRTDHEESHAERGGL